MTYVADIGQGHVVNLFGDFRWRAVRSGDQSLSAHFLQQTLWSLQRHQELALQLGPAEQNTKMSYLCTRGQQSRRRETFWHQMLTYDTWKGLKWTDWHLVFLQIFPMLFCCFFFCSNWFYDEEDKKCQAAKICMLNGNIWQNVKEDLTLKEMFVLLGSAEVSGCDSAISNSFDLGNRGLNHLERTEYVRSPHLLAALQSKNWMLNSFLLWP